MGNGRSVPNHCLSGPSARGSRGKNFPRWVLGGLLVRDNWVLKGVLGPIIVSPNDSDDLALVWEPVLGLEIIDVLRQFIDVSLGLHHMDFVSARYLDALKVIDE